MSGDAGYYRHPTIHGDRVVFVSEDDLWVVSAGGGTARRLTANPGRITFPVFSPDGTSVAFTGQDDGPNEVYVIDAEGGTPQRLTYLGGMTQAAGWTRDGRSVVFATDWCQFQPGFMHLHRVGKGGGVPQSLKHGPARAIAYEPDGKGVVIGRNSGDPARWKRYRGGTAGTLWIDRKGKGTFRRLLRLEGNLASPMWIGPRIYFLSDHEGHGNLYSCTPTGRGLKRHTHHEDYYVRFPSTDGSRIVYHAGADLYVFDPKTGEARRIPVEIRSPRAERNRKFVPAQRHLETCSLHPAGHSLAVIARGGAFTFGLWDGPVSRFGRPSRDRERHATWLSDGKRFVTVEDRGAEEALVVHSTRGSRREVEADLGRALDIVPAPAGAIRIAVSNHRQEIILVDVSSRRAKKVASSRYGRMQGMAWSPDGRYLAWSRPVAQNQARIEVLDTSTGRTRAVTKDDFHDVCPAFDPEGRYLYFISHRVFDPVYDSLCFDLGFPRGSRPYLVTLRKDVVSPFSAAHREPRGPESPPNGPPPMGKGREGGKKEATKVRIDFDGIEERVVAFPVPEGRYVDVQAGGSRVYFASMPIEGSLSAPFPEPPEPLAKAVLEAWDFEKDKKETIYGAITSFKALPDGKALAVRVGNRVRVLAGGAKMEVLPKVDQPGRESGWVDLARLRVEVVPPLEWKQMLREAWRLQRDQFWTPDMAGIDWEGVYERYLPLVDRVASRSEFSDLVWEMQGELGTSHCYEFGGDYQPVPPWHQGFLGADLQLQKKTGSWIVRRIPKGDNWEGKAASPLAAPGVGVREGDTIVAVAGEKVGRKRSPYEVLLNRAGTAVPLTVRRKAGKARTVTVQTLGSEYALRYRDWVEANRARVHRESKGTVGYVHIPDMGARGYSEFHRYFLQEVNHLGLIIDVRFNGGGHVSQILLQKLLRKRIGYDRQRWAEPASYPLDAPMGPMVALTNEYAGSDGDMFSHAFKLYGLGRLIGVRTWGGVVGIWPRHALVDGSVTTQPEFSFWFRDVGWGIENYGTDPDVEIDITPQDYAAGKDPQLVRALAEVASVIKREKPSVPDLSDIPDRGPPSLPQED